MCLSTFDCVCVWAHMAKSVCVCVVVLVELGCVSIFIFLWASGSCCSVTPPKYYKVWWRNSCQAPTWKTKAPSPPVFPPFGFVGERACKQDRDIKMHERSRRNVFSLVPVQKQYHRVSHWSHVCSHVWRAPYKWRENIPAAPCWWLQLGYKLLPLRVSRWERRDGFCPMSEF